ncbi:MAG: zinc-binding alcohol dehydrogenase family protein, partial [Actinobacteria bacterium]
MRAWAVERPGPIDGGPLVFVERPEPHPGPGEVRIKVSTCGVCRTDLHLAEGDLAPHQLGVVPGHQAVGLVDEVGPETSRFSRGDRI